MFDASDRAPSAHGILRRTKMGREVDERIVRFKNGTMAKLYHFTEENLDKGSNLLRKHNLKPAATVSACVTKKWIAWTTILHRL